MKAYGKWIYESVLILILSLILMNFSTDEQNAVIIIILFAGVIGSAVNNYQENLQ